LYGHAFNPQRRSCAPDPGTASSLAWLEQVSLPVSRFSDLGIIRAALDGLCMRVDGSRAAATTVTRNRAVFHGALGYAVELGLLPANPLNLVRWRSPRAAVAVRPAAVASPEQVRAILAEVSRVRPELTVFFGCLYYYAALRPEEAVTLRRADLILPVRGRGTIILTAACPRTGAAWTNTGTPFEPRGLKHRADGTIRIVPIPAVLAGMLRQHLHAFGTAPDGRLFRGTRGGMLSESVYGRAWHAARHAALGPGLAATALARRPYDLRHAAPVTVAECHRRARRSRSPGWQQRPRPARHVPALHRHPPGPRQPADRRRPRRRHARLSSASRRGSERLYAPSAPPPTLPAICTRTSPPSRPQPTPAGPGQPAPPRAGARGH
jgi:hypothetical protein